MIEVDKESGLLDVTEDAMKTVEVCVGLLVPEEQVRDWQGKLHLTLSSLLLGKQRTPQKIPFLRRCS